MPSEKRIAGILAVPHFHFDYEWWKTAGDYSRDVDAIIARALELLEAQPEFTYVLDQVLAVKPFWDEHPEARESLRRFVRQGRVELVGGTYCAPDENIPTGEALVRQFVHGLRFFEGEMGGVVETGWEIDEFGHPPQMPQILAGCGMDTFVFARGIPAAELKTHPADFVWRSPDSTGVLCHWLTAHYTGMIPLGKPRTNMRLYAREIRSRMGWEPPRSSSPMMFAPFGTDFQIPSADWADFVKQWNRTEKPQIKFGLPRDYFHALRDSGAEPPETGGEFNPLFTGCYESREKVKKLCRASQYAILEAEKFAAVCYAAGWMPWPGAQFDSAWENILKNDFHDVLCGTGIDPVYRNTLERYDAAMEAIEDVRGRAVNIIARHADTASRPGRPVVVFNSLNFERRDAVEIELPAREAAALAAAGPGAALTGPRGEKVPCQVCGTKLVFMAEAPPVGYAVYHLPDRPAPAKKPSGETAAGPFRVDGLVFENECVRIGLDPRTGGLFSLVDKTTGRESLDSSECYANELLVEEDVGNLWTIHKTGLEWRAGRYPVKIRVIESGPVRLTVEISGPHRDMNRQQLVTLHAGSPRVDFHTRIIFRGKDVRVSALFGVPSGGHAVFETPFHATSRGDGHHCAQTWVDVSDEGGGGLALLNRGNPGCEVKGGILSLGLMRSVSVLPPGLVRFIIQNLPAAAQSLSEALKASLSGFGAGLGEWATHPVHGLTLREWASEGAPPTSGGFPLGPDHLIPLLNFHKPSLAWERGEHEFAYALLPHAGNWADAALPRAGLGFNTPLLAVAAPRSKGSLPSAHSFFGTGSSRGAILSSLKKSEHGEGLTARVYDSLGGGAKITLEAWKKIAKCEKTNLVEKTSGGRLRVSGGRVSDSIGRWKIETYKLELG